MKLINQKTKNAVKVGEMVTSFRGETAIVTGWREPHKPSSTGRVHVQERGYGSVMEFFPSVYGLIFVD